MSSETKRIRRAVEAMLDENDMNWTMGQSMAGTDGVLYERIADKVLRKVLAAIDEVAGASDAEHSNADVLRALATRIATERDALRDKFQSLAAERLVLRNVAYRARMLSEKMKRWSCGVYEYDSAEHQALGEELDVAAPFIGHTGGATEEGYDYATWAAQMRDRVARVMGGSAAMSEYCEACCMGTCGADGSPCAKALPSVGPAKEGAER